MVLGSVVMTSDCLDEKADARPLAASWGDRADASTG